MENVSTVSSSCSSSSEQPWMKGKCIGRGSFGTVNLAVMKSDGRIFAVKSVNCSGLISQVESIENEIRFLRSISSPYVVNYLGDDVTYDGGQSYTASRHRNLHMEYLPGGTVTDVATIFGGNYADVADEGVVRSYAWCVASALSYLHAKKIVHCDVKGKNVLVGHASGTCKLADFGSAVEVSGNRKTPILPRGSPLWMAPEVIRREYQGPESDVWSLGCTVIEMISGKPAWEDEGLDTLCRIGYSDDLPEFPSQLSELGRDFLSKCLRRESSERWSCDQLLQHPFLSPPSVSSVTETSPRCVLDWINTEFSDEDDEECESSSNFESDRDSNSRIEVREISARPARGRIMELASNTGAIWESDGWVEVRALVMDRDRVDDGGGERAKCGGGGEEGEGTSSEYFDLIRSKDEIGGINLEYSNSYERASWEYLSLGGSRHLPVATCGGGGGCIAGSSCRYGSRIEGFAVERRENGFYSWCKLFVLLFFYLIKIIRFYCLYFIYNLLLLLFYFLFEINLCQLNSRMSFDWRLVIGQGPSTTKRLLKLKHHLLSLKATFRDLF